MRERAAAAASAGLAKAKEKKRELMDSDAAGRAKKAAERTKQAAERGLARLGGVVSEAAKKLVQPLIDDIAPKVALSAKMSRKDAQAKTLELAELLHAKLLKMGKTKVPWQTAEAKLMQIMNMPKPTTGASLGDTVLATGEGCDDKNYADNHPDKCESIAEGMVWQVIWCFVMYLLDTNPEMNHVGCAGFA
jgi:hypothetical protein